ncbi:cupredoxin domain-containing protein [Rhodoferax sediminis]|jgi:cytochrome c oxidase subunit 2|uniref:Cytochrome c oxidase subunit II n=1 Tax=Rhodoferax sediminis TaxID=2509614 RepID=A0A515DBR7_9BURK|nr:cupredoxin domain-containing protein [Rhodoferax sediminis]QDL37829.1 cytochrome c oxidase subunit II [Rhodoferax sediminis]
MDTNRRALISAATALALVPLTARLLAQPKPVVINVIAKKFVFVPGEIHVRKGQPVVLQLTAPEVPMGFNLPDFGVRTDVIPGKINTLQFTPDKAGSFTFLCDVFCGSGHEDMNGTLVVSE